MLLLLYRTLPPERSLPIDQRWRVLELDAALFDGIDLAGASGPAAALRRINDAKVPDVAAIPHGTTVLLVDTDTADHWNLELSIKKGDGVPEIPV